MLGEPLERLLEPEIVFPLDSHQLSDCHRLFDTASVHIPLDML